MKGTIVRGFVVRCVAAIAFVAVALTPGTFAAAQSAPASPTAAPTIWFVLQPDGQDNGSYFDVKLAAGKSADLSVTIGNGSSIPVNAVTYVADAYSDTNGGFAMRDRGTPLTGPSTWVNFEPETIEFDAGQAVKRSFSVAVPDGTPPGQYITGLAVQTAESRAVSGDSPLRQTVRLVTAIFITVPGPTTSGFDAAGLQVEVNPQGAALVGQITNTGNVRVRPEGDITLSDASGKTVATVPVKMGSVYAHDKTTFEVALTSPLPEGTYMANGTLKDPDTGATAEIKDVQVTAAAPAAPSPLTISDAVLTPQPSLDKIVFLGVKATIHNAGQQVPNGQLTLQVYRDGKLIDEHALASSLTLVSGDTVVDQPYIPASGKWDSGTYQFQLVLAQADQATGAATTIGTFTIDQTIVVP